MKWTEPEGYSPSKCEFDQLDDYASRWKLIVIALLAIVLILAAVSAWRYVADCHQHFGLLACTLAYGASWVD